MASFAGRAAWEVSAVLVILLICGCSTLPHTGPDTVPPLRTHESVVKDAGPHLLDVPDSIEGFNRGVYRFNY